MTSTNPASIPWLDRYNRISPVTVAIVVLAVRIAFGASSIGVIELFGKLDADQNGQLTTAEIPPDQQRLFTRLLRRGDTNEDQALSHDEFEAAMVPDGPEKPIETKQPSTSPQVNAVRWLLLTMDANGNARIERSEVAADLERVFDAMANRIDTNKNGVLESVELSRGGPPIAQLAGRYVQQNSIDVVEELKQFEERQGAAANRFDARPLRFDDLADPQKSHQVFLQLDINNNRQVEANEVPEPLQRPMQRLLRLADRDGDGQLSEREFLAGVRRLAGRMVRQQAGEMPNRVAVPNDAASSDGR